MIYMNNDKISIDKNTYKKTKVNGKVLKMQDVKAAEELRYPKKVVRMLEDEDDPYKRQRILTNARNGIYE